MLRSNLFMCHGTDTNDSFGWTSLFLDEFYLRFLLRPCDAFNPIQIRMDTRVHFWEFFAWFSASTKRYKTKDLVHTAERWMNGLQCSTAYRLESI